MQGERGDDGAAGKKGEKVHCLHNNIMIMQLLGRVLLDLLVCQEKLATSE